MVLASPKGFLTATTTMKHLKGDTFFNRWSCPLIPLGSMPVTKQTEYDSMFAGDTSSDRLTEDCMI